METKCRLYQFYFGIAFCLSFLLALKPAEVQASHFRGGSLSWEPLGGNDARFTLRAAFTRDEFSGTAGDGYVAVGDVVPEHIGGTRLAFGDDSITPLLLFKVIAIDPALNWWEGYALEPGDSFKTTIDHTYPSATDGGLPWAAAAASCCRSYIERNNSNLNYALRTYVELASGNTSPSTSFPLKQDVPLNTTMSFFISPVTDPDANSTLRYRMSTSSEAGDINFEQPPGMAVNNVTGEVTWNTIEALPGWHSAHITIEDSDIVAGTLLTSINIDFLLRVPGGGNDSCQYAQRLECGMFISDSTTYFTNDAILACGSATASTGPDAWYVWTGDGSLVTVSTCGSNFNSQVAVFSGTCGSLTCVDGNDEGVCYDNGGSVTFLSTAGTEYHIAVYGAAGAYGRFNLSLSCIPAPDHCADAIPLVCYGFGQSGTNMGATNDAVAACGTASASTGPDVWFKWTGTGSAVVVNTCGYLTNFDTQLSAFEGTCGSLSCVAGDDNMGGTCGTASEISFVSTLGTEYYFVVHGVGGATGTFLINLTCVNVADACADAIPIECGQAVTGTTNGATFDNVGVCGTGNTGPGVWYKFTGVPATVTVSTCHYITDYDSKISVFSGPCGALSCVGGNDDNGACATNPLSSSVTFTALDGVDYYILVHGFNTLTGAFRLDLDCVPTNDDCIDALSIACGDVVNGTTSGATDDFMGDCGDADESDGVWYSFAGINKMVTLSTCGGITDFYTSISVFSGIGCGGLTCVDGVEDNATCNFYSSEITFNTVVGTDYFVLVHGGTGNFTLSMTCFCNITATATVSSDYNGYDVSCYNAADGSATAGSPDGTPPLYVEWSNGQTTNPATGLAAGTYTVTVTDLNSCTGTASVTLSNPPKLVAVADPTSDYNDYDVRCYGGSDGVAEAFPSGGVSPYTYAWSNGQTTKIATGLSATTYTVTITDANGCQATDDTTLSQPPQMTIDAGSNRIVYPGYPDSACTNLSAEGASGGVPPYSFQWSNGSPLYTTNVCPTTSTTYYGTLTDQNGCTVTDSVKVCAIDVRCGNRLEKVTICHKSDSSGGVTMCLALNGAKSHIRNHPTDQLAACGTLKVCSFTPPSAKGDEGINYLITQDEYDGKTWLAAIPNPFADITEVRFILPADDQVSLKVYDLAGKEIAQLFHGPVASGTLMGATFDGAKYANGIYFLSLTNAKGERFVEKLTITR